jgi:hypothetical protein
MARILVALEIEHRGERVYDERDSGHVIMPNGSIVSSLDRRFLGAAAREALTRYVKDVVHQAKEVAVA